MPIVGLTTDVRRQFPSLGILRKGKLVAGKRKDGSDYTRPVDLEYFRFVNKERPDIEEVFRNAYGTEPTSLTFYFQYDTVDDVWSAWQEEWSAGGIVHRCDGETMTISRQKDDTYSHERKPCPYHENPDLRTKNNPGCKPVGRLNILLPALLEAGFIGDVMLLTGSKHDIMSIQGCLDQIEHYTRGRGLRGIEFVLRRDPREISTPATDKDGRPTRARRTKSLLTIAPAAQWVQFQLTAAKQAQLQLTPGDADDDLDDEEDLGYAAAVIPAGNGRHVEQGTGEIVDPNDDAEDAEFHENEDGPEESEPAAAENGNGNGKPQRPFTPEQLRASMAKVVKNNARFAGKMPTTQADKKQLGLLAGKLAEPFGRGKAAEQSRHLALDWLFGKASTNDLDMAEINAGLYWLLGRRGDDGKYPYNEHALEELKAIVDAQMQAAGQMPLEGAG